MDGTFKYALTVEKKSNILGHMTKIQPGDTFGRLKVIKLGLKLGKNRRWWCLCVCGNKSLVLHYSLARGATKSCGCYSQEVFARGGNQLRHGFGFMV